jgi:hypothetical protein
MSFIKNGITGVLCLSLGLVCLLVGFVAHVGWYGLLMGWMEFHRILVEYGETKEEEADDERGIG